MPSTYSRKPCTKCCRDCSPSVTISTPASSCALSHSSVASRLACSSSSPLPRQAGQSLRGSASHAGLGRLPAIVVFSIDSPFAGLLWPFMRALQTLPAVIGFFAAGCAGLAPEDAERKRLYTAAIAPCNAKFPSMREVEIDQYGYVSASAMSWSAEVDDWRR